MSASEIYLLINEFINLHVDAFFKKKMYIDQEMFFYALMHLWILCEIVNFDTDLTS